MGPYQRRRASLTQALRLTPLISPNDASASGSVEHALQDTPWWKRGVIYQIYPRSFQDERGDGVGDLRGIEQRLDYIEALGVNAIWISPCFKSPMKDFGYDVEDHRDIDPLFGTLEDFDSLVSEAHQRGIKVLIDLVLSHTADTHPWFQAARQSRDDLHGDRYVWADPGADGGPPNNWLSIFGGPAWTYEEARGQYYLHNFLSSQPDLNFHCEAVQEEALAIARWWLERGVDGFRLDTVNFYFHDRSLADNPLADEPDQQVASADNPYSLYEHIHDKNQPEVCGFLSRLGALLAEFPEAMALGEVGATEKRALGLMTDYQAPGRLQLTYTFDLLSAKLTAPAIRRILARDHGHGAGIWRCISLSNHDVQRTASRLSDDPQTRGAVASAAMAMLLSLKGTPCIYQGEELGLGEAELPFEALVDPYGIAFWPEFKGRDGCRTPMPWRHDLPQGGFTDPEVTPWLPLPLEHLERAVSTQEGDPTSQLVRTRALIARHLDTPAFWSERLALLEGPEALLVFERGEGQLLCVFNLSNDPSVYSLPVSYAASGLLEAGGALLWRDDGRVELGPWAWAWVTSQSAGV